MVIVIAKQSFYRSFNAVFRKVGRCASEDVIFLLSIIFGGKIKMIKDMLFRNILNPSLAT